MNQLEFFRRLTGDNEAEIDLSKLSSAQKARFISWSNENNFNTPVSKKPNPNKYENKIFTPVIEKHYQPSNIGIDIQSISELFPEKIFDMKSDTTLLKIFTLKEISYAETKKNPTHTLTGIFAAKEALIKLGLFNGIKDNFFLDIEIQYNSEGKPYYKSIPLSISHTGDFAVAIAILIQKRDSQSNLTEKKNNKSLINYLIKNSIIILINLFFTILILFFIANYAEIDFFSFLKNLKN